MAVVGTSEKHQAAVARGLAAGLVERYGAVGGDFAKGHVDTALVGNLLLVGVAIFRHGLLGRGRVNRVYILGPYVHLVEENLVEACKGRGAVGTQGEELADIKHHDLVEVYDAFFILFNEGVVDYVGAVTGTERKDALAPALDKPGYIFGYFLDYKIGTLACGFIYSRIYLLLSAQCCKFYLAVGIVVAARYTVQFYLAAQVSFHYIVYVLCSAMQIY